MVITSLSVATTSAVACGGGTEPASEPERFANPPPCYAAEDGAPCRSFEAGTRDHLTPSSDLDTENGEAGKPIPECDFPVCPASPPTPGTACGECPIPIGIECTYPIAGCPAGQAATTRATCEAATSSWQVAASPCASTKDGG